jgi:hypothetical protein
MDFDIVANTAAGRCYDTAEIGSFTSVGTYSNAVSRTGFVEFPGTAFVSNVRGSILVTCCARAVDASTMAVANHNNEFLKRRTTRCTVTSQGVAST